MVASPVVTVMNGILHFFAFFTFLSLTRRCGVTSEQLVDVDGQSHHDVRPVGARCVEVIIVGPVVEDIVDGDGQFHGLPEAVDHLAVATASRRDSG